MGVADVFAQHLRKYSWGDSKLNPRHPLAQRAATLVLAGVVVFALSIVVGTLGNAQVGHAAPSTSTARDWQRVLVFVRRDQSELISSRSLVSALTTQLQPHRIAIDVATDEPIGHQSWRRARSMASQRGAFAAVWYVVERDGGARRVNVRVVDLREGHRPQQLLLGPPAPGVEREMALAVRTLIGSISLRQSTSRAGRVSHASRATTLGLEIGGAYRVSLFPGGPLRHGPTILVQGEIVENFSCLLDLSLQRSAAQRVSDTRWSSWYVGATLAGRYRILRVRSLAATLGLEAQLTSVNISATHSSLSRDEHRSLWELSVMGSLSLRYALLPWLALSMQVAAGILPLRHGLRLAGKFVARTGRARFDLGMGVGVPL